MRRAISDIEKGDLVLVQPMKYCLSFISGDVEDLVANPEVPTLITHHWTGDGFKARVLQSKTVATPCGDGNEKNVEEYLEVKLFGRGRKHFTKRNEEKTKVVWVQKRLVSKCREKK